MMYNNYVRTATADEMTIYNKVENKMTDEIFELVQDESYADILAHRFLCPEIKAWMKASQITAKELATWYFID